MSENDDGIWELEIFHRKPNTEESWKKGVPSGMSVEDACEAIKKLAQGRGKIRDKQSQ